MRKLAFSGILLAGIVLLTGMAGAVERHVPSEYTTIQAAIDDCNNGDVVIIEPNTYTGTGNKNIDFGGRAIIVRSTDPNDPNIVAATIIDCEGTGRGFIFQNGETSSSILSGLTITNGEGRFTDIDTRYWKIGGAIFCSSASPQITYCKIVNNSTWYGGGMFCYYSDATISHCTISGNTASNVGGGIHCHRSCVTISHNEIINNGASGGGGIYFYESNCSGSSIDNTIIAGNHANSGGGLRSSNSKTNIRHCTIAANTADKGGGMYLYWTNTSTISNCIFWNNSATEYGPQLYLSGITGSNPTVTISYTDLQAGHAGYYILSGTVNWGLGNIDINPLFVNPASNDFHLSSLSSCINKGDPCYVPYFGETDIDGDARLLYGRVDMGADEYVTENAFINVVPGEVVTTAVANCPNPQETLSISNAGSGIMDWNVSEDCPWLEVSPQSGTCYEGAEPCEITLSFDITGLSGGQHDCNVVIYSNEAENSPQEISVTLRIYSIAGQIFVPDEYPTIQSAIDVAQPGDEVVIKPGTYISNGNRDLDFHGKAITVRSIDPQDKSIVEATVIDCGGSVSQSHRGFYFHSSEEPNSIVSGLTIKNGYFYEAGYLDGYKGGGGIYCSSASPRIEYCIVRNNYVRGKAGYGAYYGGGICCMAQSHPEIVSCTISNNTVKGGEGWLTFPVASPGASGCGGGIYFSSDCSPIIENCIICGNTAIGGKGNDGDCVESTPANGGSGLGGGIYVDSNSGIIKNCLIYDNEASGGEGGCNWCGFGDKGNCYGGGIYGSADINLCTITSNYLDGTFEEGGGVFCVEAVQIINSIMWGNSNEQIAGPGAAGSAISYCDVEGGWSGVGNINAEPLFVTGPEGDYYLSQIEAGQAVDSPCLDAGSDAASSLGMDTFTTRTDEVGDVGIVDMGYHYSMPNPADIDLDGDVDFADYAILVSQWLDTPGVPSADIAPPPSGDNIVDGLDLGLLINNWLEGL